MPDPPVDLGVIVMSDVHLSYYRERTQGRRVRVVASGPNDRSFTVVSQSPFYALRRAVQWAEKTFGPDARVTVHPAEVGGSTAKPRKLLADAVISDMPHEHGSRILVELKTGSRSPDVYVAAPRQPEPPPSAQCHIPQTWQCRWAPGPSYSTGTDALLRTSNHNELTVFTDASVSVNPSHPAVSAVSIVVPQLRMCVAVELPRGIKGQRSPTAAEAAALCAAVDLLAPLGVPLMILTDSQNTVGWWMGRPHPSQDDECVPDVLTDIRDDLRQQHGHLVSTGWVRGHNGVSGNEWADAAAKMVMRISRSQNADGLKDVRHREFTAEFSAACAAGEVGLRYGLPMAS